MRRNPQYQAYTEDICHAAECLIAYRLVELFVAVQGFNPLVRGI